MQSSDSPQLPGGQQEQQDTRQQAGQCASEPKIEREDKSGWKTDKRPKKGVKRKRNLEDCVSALERLEKDIDEAILATALKREKRKKSSAPTQPPQSIQPLNNNTSDCDRIRQLSAIQQLYCTGAALSSDKEILVAWQQRPCGGRGYARLLHNPSDSCELDGLDLFECDLYLLLCHEKIITEFLSKSTEISNQDEIPETFNPHANFSIEFGTLGDKRIIKLVRSSGAALLDHRWKKSISLVTSEWLKFLKIANDLILAIRIANRWSPKLDKYFSPMQEAAGKVWGKHLRITFGVRHTVSINVPFPFDPLQSEGWGKLLSTSRRELMEKYL